MPIIKSMNFKIFAFCLFASLIQLIVCVANPGILVQIPTDLSLPEVNLNLPITIAEGISAQKLELTDVRLRSLDYSWKLSAGRFILTIPEAVISFHWDYGSDSGLGTFTETHLQLIITWEPAIDARSRFKINVLSTKLSSDQKKSKTSINLGGNVKQTVVIQVTNLIINHAKPVFQKSITNILVGVVDSFSTPLTEDLQLYCPKEKPCIYLNMTLTSKPIVSNSLILLQINGAPYKTGSHSEYLNPSSALFKINSTNPAVQLHEELLTAVSRLYNQIQPISFTIVSTEISSVADIDSQTLSVVFPQMQSFSKPRPVLLIVDVLETEVDCIENKFLTGIGKGKASVATDATGTWFQELEPYIKQVNDMSVNNIGTVGVSIEPVTLQSRTSLKLNKIWVNDLEFDQHDIEEAYINPGQLTMHLQTLLTFAVSGLQGSLSEEDYQTQYQSIDVNPIFSFKSNSIAIQIKFIDEQKISLEVQ